MTPSDDLSPPRRPIFFPVVIATVFLTIIGMTAGFVLGERHRERSAAASTTPTRPSDDTAPPAANNSDPRPLCPQETRDWAAQEQLPADLYQVMKVVTDNGTTVWICEDPQGKLYYQGKTGGEDGPLVQRKNGLFLTDVTRLSDDEYEVVAANRSRIVVTRDLLSVFFADERTDQINKVVRVE